MDAIRINLGTPTIGTRELHPTRILRTGGELLFEMDGKAAKECYGVFDGQSLILQRSIGGEYGTVVEGRFKVKEEDKNHVLHIDEPYFAPMRISRARECEVFEFEGGTYTKIYVDGRHNLFAQDCEVATGKGKVLRLTDSEMNPMEEFDEYWIPMDIERRPATSEDCIHVDGDTEACGMDYTKKRLWVYGFITSGISRNAIMVRGDVKSMVESASFICSDGFNPFYWEEELTGEDGTPIYGEDGEVVKLCHFWTKDDDEWLKALEREFPKTDTVEGDCAARIVEEFSANGISVARLLQDESYWSVPMGFASDDDSDGLGSEDSFGERLVADLEEAAIPDIVDMERVKYIPTDENQTEVATALTFNFHFLQRVFSNGSNASLTSAYTYADGWYINPENKPATWWNGYSASISSVFDSQKLKEFYDSNGSKSDLLGYLNFIDTDVYYKKKKLSKTFIRLKFFDSKDPLSQKLLCSSTVFMDATRLYGDYLKVLSYMDEDGGRYINSNLAYDGNSKNAKAVFYDASKAKANRLDSHVTVTNEYDRTRSAEGYNLYLFSDDSDITDEGKDYRTIYMKVEFNHAGNGKTLPMILWPRNKGNFTDLTVENLSNSLYIPVHVKYSEAMGAFTYSIPSAEFKDETLIFNLFEPKINANTKEIVPFLTMDRTSAVLSFEGGHGFTAKETAGYHDDVTYEVFDEKSIFDVSVDGVSDSLSVTITPKYYNCSAQRLSATTILTPWATGTSGEPLTLSAAQASYNYVYFDADEYSSEHAKILKVADKLADRGEGEDGCAYWDTEVINELAVEKGDEDGTLKVYWKEANDSDTERWAYIVVADSIEAYDGGWEREIYVFQRAASASKP